MVSQTAAKKPRSFLLGFLIDSLSGRRLAATAELALELLDAACSVDETLLTSEGWVGIGCDVADDHLVVYTVDGFCLAATHRGASKDFRASRNVDEGNRVELWVDICFHGKKFSRLEV